MSTFIMGLQDPDDLIIIGTVTLNHLQQLRTVFTRLRNAGMQCNVTKCKFAAYETEYLGFTLTRAYP